MKFFSGLTEAQFNGYILILDNAYFYSERVLEFFNSTYYYLVSSGLISQLTYFNSTFLSEFYVLLFSIGFYSKVN